MEREVVVFLSIRARAGGSTEACAVAGEACQVTHKVAGGWRDVSGHVGRLWLPHIGCRPCQSPPAPSPPFCTAPDHQLGSSPRLSLTSELTDQSHTTLRHAGAWFREGRDQSQPTHREPRPFSGDRGRAICQLPGSPLGGYVTARCYHVQPEGESHKDREMEIVASDDTF